MRFHRAIAFSALLFLSVSGGTLAEDVATKSAGGPQGPEALSLAQHPERIADAAGILGNYLPTLTWANPLIATLEQQALLPLFSEEPIELGMSAGFPEESTLPSFCFSFPG